MQKTCANLRARRGGVLLGGVQVTLQLTSMHATVHKCFRRAWHAQAPLPASTQLYDPFVREQAAFGFQLYYSRQYAGRLAGAMAAAGAWWRPMTPSGAPAGYHELESGLHQVAIMEQGRRALPGIMEGRACTIDAAGGCWCPYGSVGGRPPCRCRCLVLDTHAMSFTSSPTVVALEAWSSWVTSTSTRHYRTAEHKALQA